MNILNDDIDKKIQKDIINNILHQHYDLAGAHIPRLIDALYANIPDNKRISYGIVHTVKVLSQYIYKHLLELEAPIFPFASYVFENTEDFKSKSVSLGVLSFYGLEVPPKVLS